MKFKIFLLVLVASSNLWASATFDYGFGSRASVAVGGTPSALYPDVFSLISYPAGLSNINQSYVSYGFLGTYGNFNTIPDVVRMNKETGGNDTLKGPVTTDYPETFGSVFALAIPIRKEYPKIVLGFGGFLPFGSLMHIEMPSPYLPVYPMYFSRAQRTNLLSSFGIELFRGFSMGGGLNYYITTSAKTFINLNAVDSTQALSMDVKTAFAPILSAQYNFDWFHVGLNYRGASDYRFDFDAENTAFSLPISISLQASAFYDPETFELNFGIPLFDNMQVATSLEWKRWSEFKTPIPELTSQFASGTSKLAFEDRWTTKLGLEYVKRPFALRGGYTYVPTHIPQQNDTNLNLLDSNKHVFSFGGGLNIDSLFGIVSNPMTLDFHAQYHLLDNLHIDKTQSQLIGAGGYDIGGSFMTYGLSFTMKL